MHNPFFPVFLVSGSPLSFSLSTSFSSSVSEWASGINSKLRGVLKLLHLLLGETGILKIKDTHSFSISEINARAWQQFTTTIHLPHWNVLLNLKKSQFPLEAATWKGAILEEKWQQEEVFSRLAFLLKHLAIQQQIQPICSAWSV